MQKYKVRKLTPRECFRLMGVSEDNIDKIQQVGISNSQQYKMAGNSIVVDVLYHLFRKMFTQTSDETSNGERSVFESLEHILIPYEYNTQNPLKVCSSFSGYDSQCMGLDMLKAHFPQFDYELVAWSEIDKFAIEAHNAVYPQWADRNLGDISKIDWEQVADFDLFTYSFPCTDISSAGLQQGLSENSGTRSSLLWECKKTIEIKKPRILLMENVEALTQEKFLPHFLKWQAYLRKQGYSNFAKVLNSKDYGIPQDRSRVFMVSILGDDYTYNFPRPFPLEKRLYHVLEENVDEKYYVKEERLKNLKIDEEKLCNTAPTARNI